MGGRVVEESALTLPVGGGEDAGLGWVGGWVGGWVVVRRGRRRFE